MATTAVYAWHPAHRVSKEGGTECRVAKSSAELAEISGVGERTIRQAKAVQTNAAPEVVAAVKSGELGLPKAAAIAKLPPAEQADRSRAAAEPVAMRAMLGKVEARGVVDTARRICKTCELVLMCRG